MSDLRQRLSSLKEEAQERERDDLSKIKELSESLAKIKRRMETSDATEHSLRREVEDLIGQKERELEVMNRKMTVVVKDLEISRGQIKRLQKEHAASIEELTERIEKAKERLMETETETGRKDTYILKVEKERDEFQASLEELTERTQKEISKLQTDLRASLESHASESERLRMALEVQVRFLARFSSSVFSLVLCRTR